MGWQAVCRNVFKSQPASFIPGCFELTCAPKQDVRGLFVKTFHKEIFQQLGIDFSLAEQYYSVSNERTLRGMHFQIPPHAHDKLVVCLAGEVLDVVVDLRKGSPAYGKAESFVLGDEKFNMLLVPKGVAHGFYVPRGQATMLYNVSSVYHEKSDMGIKWNSFDFTWPDLSPLISSRDELHPNLVDFDSPFIYELESTKS